MTSLSAPQSQSSYVERRRPDESTDGLEARQPSAEQDPQKLLAEAQNEMPPTGSREPSSLASSASTASSTNAPLSSTPAASLPPTSAPVASTPVASTPIASTPATSVPVVGAPLGEPRGEEERPDRLDELRADRDLFAKYSPLVRRIALRSIRTLPRTLTVDDIVSAGWVGMAEAIRRRPENMPEEQFEAYASYRIRGAILDYLRALDPLSRKLRNAARRIATATRVLTQELGRTPRDDEIAAQLGVTFEEYQQTLSDIQDAGFDRVEGAGVLEPQATSPSPEALASKSELVGNVAGAVEELPERLQIVLGLHYQQECSLREIGEILGVTESRVCQLHAEALQRLRARLEGKPVSNQRRRRITTSPRTNGERHRS